ncbi:Imm65 family immunity protein, partial [Bacteroides intestinalis]
MKKIYLILLFFSLLGGCQPSKESPALFAALQKVECMIEQDSFPAKYVIMYEVTSNDIGSIYQITSTDSPFVEWSLERPERVIKYKDRYICLISPMASIDISKEKLLKMTNYQNDTIGPIRNGMWYIGVSKDGKKQSLVSTHTTYLTSRFYTFPKLLEYIFNDYDEVNLPRFVLGMYSLVVDTSYTPKEAFRDHIQYIEGDIYYTNPFDEYFTEDKDSIHSSFFAVLNGKDTLKLNITDTIMQCLFFESMNNPIFFKSLPQQEPW